MNDKHPEDQQDAVPEGEGAPEPGRRQFAKLGLLAPPVILSLASRPVWGTGSQLVCHSAHMSGNLSRKPADCQAGCPPKYWKDKCDKWMPHACFANGVKTTYPDRRKYRCLSGKPEKFSGYWQPASATDRANNAIWDSGTSYQSFFNVAAQKNGFSGMGRLIAPRCGSDQPLRRVFFEEETGDACYLASALFNSLLVPDYVLTPNQVIQLACGATPPGGMSLKAYLAYTWPAGQGPAPLG